MSEDTYLPASAFAAFGLESDQLRMASDRGDLACQRPRTSGNRTGRRRYLVRDVEARWPECFTKNRTNPDKDELSTDSGGFQLTGDVSGGIFDDMNHVAPFQSVKRAAAQVGVPVGYLKARIRDGSVPALKVGRGMRCDPRAVRAALSRLASESTGARPQE